MSNRTNLSDLPLKDFHPEVDNFQFILYQVCVPILFGSITLVGFIGNSLVIYIILSEARMRTVTNHLLLNLALADLAFVLVIPPFTAYEFATAGWPFGLGLCRIMHYLVNVTAYVTVYTIVLISITRYLSVVRGPETAWLRTGGKAAISLLLLWLIVCLLNLPVYYSYNIKYYHWMSLDPQSHTDLSLPECDVTSLTRGRYLYSLFFLFAYLLPLILVSALHLSIIRHVTWTRSLGRHQHYLTTGQENETEADNEADTQIHPDGHVSRRQGGPGRMLVCVVLMFAVLWLPIHIHLLIAYFGHIPDSRVYEAISMIWNALAYLNSCVNPIIYNFTSREFRLAFRRLLGPQIRPVHQGGVEANRKQGVNDGGCYIGGVMGRGREAQLTYTTTYERVNQLDERLAADDEL